MKLIEYHQLVIQGMAHLRELLDLDFVWYDNDFQLVNQLTGHVIPEVLDFHVEEEYPAIIDLIKNNKNCYCVATTIGYLDFIFLPLYYENDFHGIMRIGPAATTSFNNNRVSEILKHLKLSLDQRSMIMHFYSSIPLMTAEDYGHIGHLGLNLFGEKVPLARAVYYSSEKNVSIDSFAMIQRNVETEDIDAINERYHYEAMIYEAFRNRDRDKLNIAINAFDTTKRMKDRHPNQPLRSAKNLAIVLNTILRHSAQRGGLKPLYLDRLSRKYAILIEQCKTRTELKKLQLEMYDVYFDTLIKHTYDDVSPFIRNVLEAIQMNLDKKMTVSSLAEDFNVKPSNLANSFKRETGKTISAHVNEKRIAEACTYLVSTQLPINEIALIVGYTDINYFTKQFKKVMAMTPTQYRE